MWLDAATKLLHEIKPDSQPAGSLPPLSTRDVRKFKRLLQTLVTKKAPGKLSQVTRWMKVGRRRVTVVDVTCRCPQLSVHATET